MSAANITLPGPVPKDMVLPAAKEVNTRKIRVYWEGGVVHLYVAREASSVVMPLPPVNQREALEQASFDPKFLMAVRASMQYVNSEMGFSPFTPVRVYEKTIDIPQYAKSRDRIIDGIFRNRHKEGEFTFAGNFWAMWPPVMRLLCYKTYKKRGLYKGPGAITNQIMQDDMRLFAVDVTRGSWRPAYFDEMTRNTIYAVTTQKAHSKPILVRDATLQHLIKVARTQAEAPPKMLMSVTRMVLENSGHYTFKPYPDAIKKLGAWSTTAVTHVNRLMGVPETDVLYHIGANFEPTSVRVSSTEPGMYIDDSQGRKAPHFVQPDTVNADEINNLIAHLGNNNPSAVAMLNEMQNRGKKRKKDAADYVTRVRPTVVGEIVVMRHVKVPRKSKRSRRQKDEASDADDNETDTDDDANPFDNDL